MTPLFVTPTKTVPVLHYVAVQKTVLIQEYVWMGKNFTKTIANITLNACPDAAWEISALTSLIAIEIAK
jgi:hypothetical protein